MEHKVPLNDNNFTCLKPENITDLPIDVMILIFKFLTPMERLRTITVCNDWLQLVNNFFSKDHCLVLTRKVDYSSTGSIYKTFSDRLEKTKHMRSFSHLIIKSFPNDDVSNLSNVHKFLDLIGNEIKCLVIEKGVQLADPRSYVNWYNNNLYAKMPNLESLEVFNTNFLRDLSSVTNLKMIKAKSTFQDLKILKHCRDIKNIESLTAVSIRIMKKDIDDESLTSFMEPNTKELLKQMIGSKNDFITLKSNFNFCSETKFSVDDVSEMQMETSKKPPPANTLSKFQNLKKLTFRGNGPLVLTKEPAKYSGITHLVLDVYGTEVCPHFDNLLQNFTDLEFLRICYHHLTDDLFSIICQFMPKLKELVFLSSSQISIEAVLATNKYSLKDLPLLERLFVQTKDELVNGNHEWPVLPDLKGLILKGRGWQHLDQIFYAQIAKNSPKITEIVISFKEFEIMRNRFSKFLPLIKQLKLTYLNLPGDGSEGNDDVEALEPNKELVTNVSDHCKHLQQLNITDNIDLSLQQKILLFNRIPSLNKIRSAIVSLQEDFRARFTEMTRNDFNNIQ